MKNIRDYIREEIKIFLLTAKKELTPDIVQHNDIIEPNTISKPYNTVIDDIIDEEVNKIVLRENPDTLRISGSNIRLNYGINDNISFAYNKVTKQWEFSPYSHMKSGYYDYNNYDQRMLGRIFFYMGAIITFWNDPSISNIKKLIVAAKKESAIKGKKLYLALYSQNNQWANCRLFSPKTFFDRDFKGEVSFSVRGLKVYHGKHRVELGDYNS